MYLFSTQFLLYWAAMALSLFNTILLLWLGLAVLLNAEQRTWGIWLACSGLLLAGAFFVSHSAILGYGLHYIGPGTNFWWRLGWIPVVALPFAWYVIILWYGGYWDDAHSPLHRRHRFWLFLTGLLAIGSVALLAFANPLPSYWQVAHLDLSAAPQIRGIPLLILSYPAYIILCILLSLDVLRRPGPSGRVMGEQARRRARPWLIAASAALLLVSLLVGLVMGWIVLNARQRALYDIYTDMSSIIVAFDLAIAALIACAIVFLGQAIVSYEVFAGKTLPRRGLIRHWRRAIILAAGYGLAIGWTLTYQLRSIYSLLLTAILMTLFYALLSWRSYAERERTIEQLRPFVASQKLYEHLISPAEHGASEVDVAALLEALCADVLGARVGFLAPLGPLTPLVGSVLTYPQGRTAPTLGLSQLAARLATTKSQCTALDPTEYEGATWAVPLRSDRKLVGVLLFGDKEDGGLYTEEEIELAQASGERLMDTQASAEIARRLMALQRQRLAESQVLDQRTRRVLHDEVLPLLHTALLALSRGRDETDADRAEAVALLTDAHHQISDLLQGMSTTTTRKVARLGLAGALQRVVEAELAGAFDEVAWQLAPEAEREMQALPALTAEVLFFAAREALRNAARHANHGEPHRPLHLCVTAAWHPPAAELGSGHLELCIEDNGVGLEVARSSEGESGQGLALHSTMMAVVGGTLAVESLPGAYTRVLLTLPLEQSRH